MRTIQSRRRVPSSEYRLVYRVFWFNGVRYSEAYLYIRIHTHICTHSPASLKHERPDTSARTHSLRHVLSKYPTFLFVCMTGCLALIGDYVASVVEVDAERGTTETILGQRNFDGVHEF